MEPFEGPNRGFPRFASKRYLFCFKTMLQMHKTSPQRDLPSKKYSKKHWLEQWFVHATSSAAVDRNAYKTCCFLMVLKKPCPFAPPWSAEMLMKHVVSWIITTDYGIASKQLVTQAFEANWACQNGVTWTRNTSKPLVKQYFDGLTGMQNFRGMRKCL